MNDDDTVEETNISQEIASYDSVRMTMMFKIPGKKEGYDDDDAPLLAIKKMNEMLKALTNKLPCFVGPWKSSNLAYGALKKKTYFRFYQKTLILLNPMFSTTIDF